MQYEAAEGYPAFEATDDKGFPKFYPLFGYPQQMLHMAIARDDPVGFQFYFERHFAGGFEILGSSRTLDQYAEDRGAVKVAAWLRKNGNVKQTPLPSSATR